MKQRPTVAAISTPHGVGGIGVIRISGNEALQVLKKMFKPAREKDDVSQTPGYRAVFGRVIDPNTKEEIDEAVAVVFRAPRSFTGEDVAEVTCHGGIHIMQRALRACLDAGALMAGRGEFTKRAFLNGKLDLTQAEAISDLIYAESDFASKAALAARDGLLSQKAAKQARVLTDLAGHISAWTDFPEEDVEALSEQQLCDTLLQVQKDLDNLLLQGNMGSVMRDGIDTVIVGKPNVGKSTLMNLLAGEKISIVTDIPGTTRDVVRNRVVLGDVILNVSDTAGLRATEDPVEKEGVALAKSRMHAAALVLAVFDASALLDERDEEILKDLAGKQAIAILNKCDLGVNEQTKARLEKEYPCVCISAKNADGLLSLSEAVVQRTQLSEFDAASPIAFNERQRACVYTAKRFVDDAIASAQGGFTLDATGVCIDSALDSLFELTGQKTSEEIVENVFSRFCVGK